MGKQFLDLCHIQQWGQDEVRITTMRGCVIVRTRYELQEEINDIESSLKQERR